MTLVGWKGWVSIFCRGCSQLGFQFWCWGVGWVELSWGWRAEPNGLGASLACATPVEPSSLQSSVTRNLLRGSWHFQWHIEWEPPNQIKDCEPKQLVGVYEVQALLLVREWWRCFGGCVSGKHQVSSELCVSGDCADCTKMPTTTWPLCARLASITWCRENQK